MLSAFVYVVVLIERFVIPSKVEVEARREEMDGLKTVEALRGHACPSMSEGITQTHKEG